MIVLLLLNKCGSLSPWQYAEEYVIGFAAVSDRFYRYDRNEIYGEPNCNGGGAMNSVSGDVILAMILS